MPKAIRNEPIDPTGLAGEDLPLKYYLNPTHRMVVIIGDLTSPAFELIVDDDAPNFAMSIVVIQGKLKQLY